MKNKPKILIVRLSAIGDVVHSLPILNMLRKKFPDSFIAWAVEERSADILVNNPLLDKVYIFPKKKWNKKSWAVIKEIRKEKFDIAIDLQELFKSGIITFLSGAKTRIAHAKTREFADIFVNVKLPAHDTFDHEKLIIERYLEPAKYLGASVDEVKFSLPPIEDSIKSKVSSLFASLEKEIVIFSPATIWSTKHWLENYWAELLDKLVEKYNVVFIGSANDNELIQRITSHAKTDNYLNLAGKTSLLELIEIFNRAKYVIAPDTGPAHIANATQVPSIIMIFGPTGVKRTPPYGEKHSALSTSLPCQPCFKRNCPRKDVPLECMKKITPDMILEKIF
ncbi:MAG: lipopolysaccharide heptosyltransferase II [Candidatus Melainabacteria bacterium GWF2_37_15]|nr:MAG: lipopolysaccharide heptosyltransferase II [Candidatus Melainabacteria bacterium GWF2_37_15]